LGIPTFPRKEAFYRSKGGRGKDWNGEKKEKLIKVSPIREVEPDTQGCYMMTEKTRTEIREAPALNISRGAL